MNSVQLAVLRSMKSAEFRVLLAVAGRLGRAEFEDRPQGWGINWERGNLKASYRPIRLG